MSSAARSRRRKLLRQIATCPDCSAHVRVVSDDPVRPRVQIKHDSTCPKYRQGNSGQPFSQYKLIWGAL